MGLQSVGLSARRRTPAKVCMETHRLKSVLPNSFRRACFHYFADDFLGSGFLFRANDEAPVARFGKLARRDSNFAEAQRSSCPRILRCRRSRLRRRDRLRSNPPTNPAALVLIVVRLIRFRQASATSIPFGSQFVGIDAALQIQKNLSGRVHDPRLETQISSLRIHRWKKLKILRYPGPEMEFRRFRALP